MKYTPRNIARQHTQFCDIREVGGVELTNDVYARVPSSDTFWFIGKVARVSDVSLPHCIARQYALIEQHAANLRPLELYPKRGSIEVWTAPGDSELEVAYNKPDLIFQRMERNVDGALGISKYLVGFQGEIYQKGEEGFRTWRTNDGRPSKPEVQPAGTKNVSSEEELDQILQKMKGMDISELYKEQEKREGRAIED
jgi:hypothetical protein